jgi:hypothetical protein
MEELKRMAKKNGTKILFTFKFQKAAWLLQIAFIRATRPPGQNHDDDG